MSNIRKSFSFREGVQVDNEVFVVRGALVGIGTTIPTEKLDVVGGTVRVAGLITAANINVSGVTTSSKIRVGNNINISGDSGIITATSFYGNGSTLSNLPTSQWIDTDVGLGFTSIYSQGNVGIATNDPRSTFQIGGNPNTGQAGLGINSTGGVRTSGVVTAYSFVGFGTDIVNLDADNISSGTLNPARIASVNNSSLPSNISVSGIITASSGFSGNLVGNVTGNVTGSITGNVTGTSSLSLGLTGTPNITVGIITSSNILVSSALTASSITSSSGLDVGAAGTGLYVSGGRIGIGTSVPTVDVQVRKRGIVTLEVVSDNNESRISIGQSIGIGNSTGLLRYGNTKGTFDVINRSLGSLNNIIHAGSAGVGTGNFNWVYGQNNAILLTLTYDGKLGVGKTNPTNTFEVVGTSTITGNSFVGGNFSTPGSITFGTGVAKATLGSLSETPLLYNTNLNSNVGITTILNLNVLNKIGIANSNPTVFFDASGKTALVGNLGIATAGISTTLQLGVYGPSIFTQAVGVGSTAIYTSGTEEVGLVQITDGAIKFYGAGAIFLPGSGVIGINTSIPQGALDLSRARNFDVPTERTTFVPPVLTTTEVGNLGTIPTGGVVYNGTNGRLLHYNGFEWGTAGPVGWINFDGSGVSASIRAEYGVDTVVKNSTGDYTVNFNGPLEDANYSVQVTVYDNSSLVIRYVSDMDLATSSTRIRIRNAGGSLVDADTVMAVIFR